MKKNITVMIVLILTILNLTACSKAKEQSEQVNATVKNSTSKPVHNTTNRTSATLEAKISVNEQVLLDEGDIKITLISLDNEGYWGPSLKLYVENNSDKDVTIKPRDVSINDIMIRVLYSYKVQAGDKGESDFDFSSSDLETAGIETIKDIQLKFNIVDTSTDETIFGSDVINITTSADPSYVQSYDDSGFVALDQNGYKIVVKNVDDTESYWGADIYLYIENNSNTNITIQVRDTSINGISIDPMFSCNVEAGKKAFDSISFLEDDLTKNNIEKIENLECSYTILDASTFGTLLNSDSIVVNFDE